MQNILATHGDRPPDAAGEPKLLKTPIGMTTAGTKPSTTSARPHHAALLQRDMPDAHRQLQAKLIAGH